MEAEEVLNLFDSYWFELEIFKTLKVHEKVEIRTPRSARFLGSGQISFNSDSTSLKLGNIPSGKVVKYNSSFEIREGIYKKKLITRRNRSCKSLSELEFEELKGFKDLGFVFSEEDKDSELVLIVPGLNRLGRTGVEEPENENAISRPYLSEAWGVIDRKMVNIKLIDRNIQALNDRTNLKQHLKVWAQTVALTVRF